MSNKNQNQIYNIYCDESCHLEHDRLSAMALGAILCPASYAKQVAKCIRDIKQKHGLSPTFEIKWVKVSPGKIAFYKDILDYCFREDNLQLRVVLIPNKNKLNHDFFKQNHDDWYYKMYFILLKQIIKSDNSYNIYIDIKDTRSQEKIIKLHNYLCNHQGDINKQTINKIQQIRSHETEHLQIIDLFIGALTYTHRKLKTSTAKLELIKFMQKCLGSDFLETTSLNKNKFNVLIWNAKDC